MNLDTEIASDYTVGRYKEIRSDLSLDHPTALGWIEVLAAFRRRIRERFLLPIRELARHDKKGVLPNRPGFAIMALDCLLIDTIQSFREGRVSTGKGEVNPAASFKTFLKRPSFADFAGKDRREFFDYVRNAILHNGETRKDWKIRIDTPKMLVKDQVSGTKTINRRMFHAGVIREFRQLCRELKHSRENSPSFPPAHGCSLRVSGAAADALLFRLRLKLVGS